MPKQKRPVEQLVRPGTHVSVKSPVFEELRAFNVTMGAENYTEAIAYLLKAVCKPGETIYHAALRAQKERKS